MSLFTIENITKTYEITSRFCLALTTLCDMFFVFTHEKTDMYVEIKSSIEVHFVSWDQVICDFRISSPLRFCSNHFIIFGFIKQFYMEVHGFEIFAKFDLVPWPKRPLKYIESA